MPCYLKWTYEHISLWTDAQQSATLLFHNGKCFFQNILDGDISATLINQIQYENMKLHKRN